MPPKREFSSLQRKSGFRDSKLIIVATEGVCAEKQYFGELAKTHQNSRVHVEILKRDPEKSSPKHVLESLNEFKNIYHLRKQDELWMVVDLDKWQERELSEVAQSCFQKDYKLAVSNPCFELWLLLHVKSPEEYTEDKLAAIATNKHVSRNRTQLGKELMDVLGSYNKSDINPTQFLPLVDTAIARAKTLDIHPKHRWPQSLGTRVYLLVELIINK